MKASASPVVMIVRGLSRLVAALPLGAALRFGRGLGWVFGNVIRYHRRDAREALRRSLPELTGARRRKILAQMYAGQGMLVVEILRQAAYPGEEVAGRIDVEGKEHLEGALARGKGVLVLTAHVGNWDLLGMIARRFGYPLTIIAKDIKNSALNAFIIETREKSGVRVVSARRSYRACLSALRKNELVGFVLDQNMIAAEGVFVDFFGRPACTTPGLAFMAAHSGAPVVPVFMIRRPSGGHVVKILPALDPPPDREEATLRRATQEYTRIIEEIIRRHPEQWIWIHRRWRTKPPPAGGDAADKKSAANL